MDANFNSVSLLPFDRMAAITCERFFFEKTSAIVSGVHSTEDISLLKVQSLKFVCFAAGILVIHVPAEGEPEFVNEVVARLLFLIGGGQVEFLVGPEIGNQFFHPAECFVEARWHGGFECAPERRRRQETVES